jgi:hypothetical protein
MPAAMPGGVETRVGKELQEPFVQREGMRAGQRAADHQGDGAGVRCQPVPQLQGEVHRVRFDPDPSRDSPRSCSGASGPGTSPTSMLPTTISTTKAMPPAGARRSM